MRLSPLWDAYRFRAGAAAKCVEQVSCDYANLKDRTCAIALRVNLKPMAGSGAVRTYERFDEFAEVRQSIVLWATERSAKIGPHGVVMRA
jgi:hypothetical protein